MRGKPGRHAPAFVLLELAKTKKYGMQILKGLNERMPNKCLDSAAVYRALASLEKDGCVLVKLDNDENGVSKKYYELTDKGREELALFYEDMQMRVENLTYFLRTYEGLGDSDD